MKQGGKALRDRKENKTGDEILKIVEETRKKWAMKKYEEERQELEEKKKEKVDVIRWGKKNYRSTRKT